MTKADIELSLRSTIDRIRNHVHVTPILKSHYIDSITKANVFLSAKTSKKQVLLKLEE